GAGAFGYLGLFQVTRCKSKTKSRRYQKNGYAPQPKSKKKGRHNPTLRRPEGDRKITAHWHGPAPNQ
ncbi:hypothetical protein, partial [Pseudomonas fluorescens]|uniref:hypothetical protein n=1 Tax=Pseudomonas fluorescens TaxID=294 RepID=UPI001C828DC7